MGLIPEKYQSFAFLIFSLKDIKFLYKKNFESFIFLAKRATLEPVRKGPSLQCILYFLRFSVAIRAKNLENFELLSETKTGSVCALLVISVDNIGPGREG